MPRRKKKNNGLKIFLWILAIVAIIVGGYFLFWNNPTVNPTLETILVDVSQDAHVLSTFSGNQGFTFQTLVSTVFVPAPIDRFSNARAFYTFNVPANLDIVSAKLVLKSEDRTANDLQVPDKIDAYYTSSFEELGIDWENQPDLGGLLSSKKCLLDNECKFSVTNYVKENVGKEVNFALVKSNEASEGMIFFVAKEQSNRVGEYPVLEITHKVA